ncbi:hypothetical protein GWK47_009693 [Chionoecetes opilio]|uniref:Uncharacterized protein n=1 Tax=Chionoecetes opilio TaxID=41210 RepID=A0A8J5CNG9_CHIOP|nr:hypothetical protein GWK47_009693 [Chionoecetes opilio]
MPAHPKAKSEPDKHSQPLGHGAPMKRTGTRAEEWDSVIGPSLATIPATQLPTVRTIFQRYRACRIEQPREPVATLAKLITTEVKAIWDRARVPTTSDKNCVRKVQERIELWNSVHNSGEHSEKLLSTLGSLFDLAPKLRGGKATEEAKLEHLQSLMRQACDMKRRKSEGDQYDWMVDYGFYLDQYKGDRVQTLGPADKKLYLLQKEKDENDRKLAKYHDQQSTSTEARYV